MAKKKRKSKGQQFLRKNNIITYDKYKPNRQARRLGIKAETPPQMKEEPKRKSKAAVLSQKVRQAQETQKRIIPPGMTYGEYMEYLKGKRQELEEKKQSL